MYIVEEKRELLNPHIESLITELAHLQLDDPEDDISSNIEYVVLQLLSQIYTKDESAIRDALGLLSNVKSEFYRRVAAPYYVQSAFDKGDTVDMAQTANIVEIE